MTVEEAAGLLPPPVPSVPPRQVWETLKEGVGPRLVKASASQANSPVAAARPQRIKLAKATVRRRAPATGKRLYILDEPNTGLPLPRRGKTDRRAARARRPGQHRSSSSSQSRSQSKNRRLRGPGPRPRKAATADRELVAQGRVRSPPPPIRGRGSAAYTGQFPEGSLHLRRGTGRGGRERGGGQ